MDPSANIVQKSLFIYDPQDKRARDCMERAEVESIVFLKSGMHFEIIGAPNRFRYFYLRLPELGCVFHVLKVCFRTLDEVILISEYLSIEVKHRLMTDTDNLLPFEYFAHWHLFESWTLCFGYILNMAKDPHKKRSGWLYT